ncbi:glycoside hydrolase family 32 protein [Flavobacteriaceae bacterium TP-CH-4]|uniref:Glycoside hydrolase family 32 protein n=2 Tax=Pelagihabitans pacificus TaxID=2696054 RepID=A0A967AX14_9FLAO|nr:glycoside hydrolase family 32 protein [Pelagihabitans pacificus]
MLAGLAACKNKESKVEPTLLESVDSSYKEAFRPQFHFSPQEKWMNDPNGMVYHEGIYHLFYQYYPEDIVWGPMHWGHAISTDLVHWNHKPIALFPDEHGYIFSGSAVVDTNNTSGFGTADNAPLVAVFTYHDMEGEKAGRNNYQTQGIAYSLDNGDTWTKYEGNPVIGNEGLKDFRDPKVFWDDQSNQWIMSLVAGDHLQLWGSSNLKVWSKLSEFGRNQGAHGGVWECPDLFKVKVEDSDEEKWVLLISMNPGAPNGGSGTQYFVGDFDGKRFTTDQKGTRWLDWGTDNYAGVTYSNAPDDKPIFIGWMSNWAYARETPTEMWRSAMTVPRTLYLEKIADEYTLFNYPIKALETLRTEPLKKEVELEVGANENIELTNLSQAEVKFTTSGRDFILKLKNSNGEETVLTMDSGQQLFLLDRIASGKTDFNERFANTMQQIPIENLPGGEYEVRILIDWSSVEVFIDKGQYVMTAQIFPTEHYTTVEVQNTSKSTLRLKEVMVSPLKGIW